MDNDARLAVYLKGLIRIQDGNGRYRVTPKQRRRLQHKLGKETKKWRRQDDSV
jgi:hypothetical protein